MCYDACMEQLYSQEEIPFIAKKVLTLVDEKGCVALGFSGDLGAGKTTLIQEIGKLLGVQEIMQSPTFTLMKVYETTSEKKPFLVHMDMYRIENEEELVPLQLQRFFDGKHFFCIEWPEKVPLFIEQYHVPIITISHEGDKRKIVTP